jgi:type IV pilus assembly protein PilW
MTRPLFGFRPIRYKQGVTLVELMVSMTIGMFVVIATTSLFSAVKTSYVTQDEISRIDEQGRFVLEGISRAIRQAGHENWDVSEAPVVAAAPWNASIIGLDASTLKETTPGIESPVKAVSNGSDVLAVRYFGSGTGTNGDGTVLNCAGFGVAAPSTQSTAERERAWSVFFVGVDSSGEPELRCKYMGKTSWSADAIARGVESFQVLYGVDIDDDGIANRFVNAASVHILDQGIVPEGESAAERSLDRQRRSFWNKVVSIKISVLLRGAQRVREDEVKARYDLFGADYAGSAGLKDAGTTIRESDLPAKTRNRLRKLFSTTVQLRNSTRRSIS